MKLSMYGFSQGLAGVVRAPLFSTRAGGTPAVSCRLECGAFYTQDALRESGYLPDGRPAVEALACVEATLAAHHLGALVFPQALRLVGYGDLAYRFAEMAPEGAEVAVHAYGRTFRPGGEGPRRAPRRQPRRGWGPRRRWSGWSWRWCTTPVTPGARHS